MSTRPNGRRPDEIRKIDIITGVNRYAEGSCLISCGNTQVLCTASVENRVPPFLKGSGSGWVTAEYSMLPRATHSRNQREAAKGKQGGRTLEIQRLIGRALRAALDLKTLGENSITIDCDVLQADGGTRTASITGGYVALNLAIKKMLELGTIKEQPKLTQIAAISCGICNGEAVADLDYAEDSSADADVNFVLNGDGRIIEIQGTAEKEPFSDEMLDSMRALAKKGMAELFRHQLEALRG